MPKKSVLASFFAIVLLVVAAVSCADSHVNVRGQYDFSAGYVKGLSGR
jgi:hypothetical protein